MPGRLSNAEVQVLLNNRFGAAAVPAPPTQYLVGLSSTLPTNEGTNITEPAVGAYARVTVANNAANFPAISGTARVKSNGTAITFPQATADWGVLPYFVLFDQNAGFRAWGTVTAPGGGAVAAIVAGTVATFAVGTLQVAGIA